MLLHKIKEIVASLRKFIRGGVPMLLTTKKINFFNIIIVTVATAILIYTYFLYQDFSANEQNKAISEFKTFNNEYLVKPYSNYNELFNNLSDNLSGDLEKDIKLINSFIPENSKLFTYIYINNDSEIINGIDRKVFANYKNSSWFKNSLKNPNINNYTFIKDTENSSFFIANTKNIGESNLIFCLSLNLNYILESQQILNKDYENYFLIDKSKNIVYNLQNMIPVDSKIKTLISTLDFSKSDTNVFKDKKFNIFTINSINNFILVNIGTKENLDFVTVTYIYYSLLIHTVFLIFIILILNLFTKSIENENLNLTKIIINLRNHNSLNLRNNSFLPEFTKVYHELQKTADHITTVETEAITDELTRLYNRHHLEYYFDSLSKRNKLFYIFMFDIDNFKSINDSFGHQIGDIVLQRVASLSKNLIDEDDKAFRYGGDEFIIIFNNKDFNSILTIVETLRYNINTMNWREKTLSVSISGGLCSSSKHRDKNVISDADQLLYLSKTTGKNKISFEK